MTTKTLTWVLLSIVTLAMTACGASLVDSRQLEFHNGLAYVRNHEDPFTGHAIFAQSIPRIVNDFYFAAAQAAFRGYMPATGNMRCDVTFEKGVVQGEVSCKDVHGNTALQFTIHSERIDGSAIVNASTDANRKIAELTWKNGALQGRQKFYGNFGNTKNTVVDDLEIANGVKDGRETYRDEDGNVLGDGVWSKGKPVKGSFVDTWQDGSITKILTIENGTTNGKASYYSSEKGPDGKPLISTGDYLEGKRSGPWVDYGMNAVPVANTLLQMFPILGNYPKYGGILQTCNSFRSNWDHGELKGKLECDAQDGSPSLSFEVQDGLVADNVIYHTPRNGELVRLPPFTHEAQAEDPSALPSGPLTGNALDSCVNRWIAYKQASNAWAPISSAQMSEWRDACSQGQRPPRDH